MSSGRRESVMIFCISPISKVYIEPIDHYEPDVVHVFIGNGKDAVSSVARDVYNASKENITCKRIVEHKIDTSDYNEVLGEIIEIMNDLHKKYGKDLDIFINISSGTPEFSAAGMFASMLPQSAIAFKVDADYSLSPEELSKMADALNSSASVSEPEMVTGLKNDGPDDEMIIFLRIVDDILKDSKYPKYRIIIERLKDADAWSYDPDKKSGYGRTSLQEREERYLKRHYISIALENGWIEKPSPNTMRMTDSGKAYISVYRVEDECRVSHKAMINCSRHYSDGMFFEEDLCSMSICPEDEPEETNTVTFRRKNKKYTFTIGMDQHR